MPLTADTITTAQISALHAEAMRAGDYAMADICDVALVSRETTDDLGGTLRDGRGNELTRTDAREACADAINDAAVRS